MLILLYYQLYYLQNKHIINNLVEIIYCIYNSKSDKYLINFIYNFNQIFISYNNNLNFNSNNLINYQL